MKTILILFCLCFCGCATKYPLAELQYQQALWFSLGYRDGFADGKRESRGEKRHIKNQEEAMDEYIWCIFKVDLREAPKR